MKSQSAMLVYFIKPLQCSGLGKAFVLAQRDDDGLERIITYWMLFLWKTPTSPHLASRLGGLPVCNAEVLELL
jgi:hypothetical protein